MKGLKRLSAAAVLIAISSFATASPSLAKWHHHRGHWHHHYYGGGAGSFERNPRNAESA